MIVLKFGGTSVADADAMRRLVRIVVREVRSRIVVVSALAGVTDQLVELAQIATEGNREEAEPRISALARRHLDMAAAVVSDGDRRERLASQIRRSILDLRTLVRTATMLRRVSPALLDIMMAQGEIMSSRMAAAALEDVGVPATWFDPRDVVTTDADHGRAVPDLDATAACLRRLVLPCVTSGQVAVIAGFVGSAPTGATTTLGRGGSDYSASVIGRCMYAEEIQIWTDVDGMLTADPRVLSSVRAVPHLSFREASELAHFGAKVLHPSTILPAVENDIPVRILNSNKPHAIGTWITRSVPADRPAAAIASLDSVALIQVEATGGMRNTVFLAQVLGVFEELGIETHAVTAGEGTLSALVRDGTALGSAIASLDQIARVTIASDIALVAVVGERLARDAEAASALLDALRGMPVPMVSRPASGCHFAVAVPAGLMRAAVSRLHDYLFGVEVEDLPVGDSKRGPVVVPWRSPQWGYAAKAGRAGKAGGPEGEAAVRTDEDSGERVG